MNNPVVTDRRNIVMTKATIVNKSTMSMTNDYSRSNHEMRDVTNGVGTGTIPEDPKDEQKQIAAKVAHEATQNLLRASRKVSINFGKLQFGDRLGKGGFCNVHEASLNDFDRSMKRMNSGTILSDIHENRVDTSTASPKKTVAVKRLRDSIRMSELVDGVADLATEAALLSSLSHKHIVQVHGMAAGPIQDSVASKEGFFVVMEKLGGGTLQQRLASWKKTERMSPNLDRRAALMERLQYGLQLAKAVEYLHQQGLVHRDLKPANVGFDNENVLKLFDFGLATPVPKDGLEDVAGTLRYMAPEMALPSREHRKYNETVDVYSFSLLLWELCTCERPFHEYSQQALKKRVIRNGKRPAMARWWPRTLRKTMQAGWSSNPDKRPSMEEIVQKLTRVLEKRGYDTDKDEDVTGDHDYGGLEGDEESVE